MSFLGKILIPIERWVRLNQFQPVRLALFINPVYIVRRPIFLAFKRHAGEMTGKMLDYGCGNSPYQTLFNGIDYWGIDISVNEEKDQILKFDGNKIPFDDDAFNSVLCSEVLEHVPNVESTLSEICRVLKPGGKLLLSVPFMWEEHGHPNDFRRYTLEGIRSVLKYNGFDIISAEKTSRSVKTITQLISSRVYNRIQSKYFYLNVFLIALFVSPINFTGCLLSFLFKGSDHLYLNTVILAKRND